VSRLQLLTWTLALCVSYTILACVDPAGAGALTVPVSLAVVLPALYHRAHEQGRRNA
jgi:hypothetical protein